MIIFHAKLDGTVTTTPGFVPMSSALADLVVVSDFDYAICTIKLEPSSGIQIPDIVCNFVLSSETGATVWTAPLPPEATVLHGSVGYQLIFSAADGMKQSTLEGAFDVPKGVITNMPANVGDLSSKTVADLYTLLATIYGIYKDLEDSLENIPHIGKKLTIDVVSLPTSDIDTEATYRVLCGTFVLGKMLRNDSTCHMVEWDSVPTEPGESVINDNNGAFSYVGYYNVKDNTVYGYFGTETIEFLLDWVDASDLNYLTKVILKAYLNNMKAGWKTMQEIVSSVGSALSMTWGGVIPSVESAGDDNALFLYLYTKMFIYKNGVWIGLDEGVGKAGEGIGAEVFNHPDNVATGMASHAEGSGTAAEGDFSHAEGSGSNASGPHSHTEGLNTTASGDADHAEGNGSIASGNYSHAEGSETKSSGQTSHAEGFKTEASGSSAHAEGDTTKAIGAVSHAEGSMTTAGDTGAHAEGGSTNANAAWAHTEGYGTTVNGVAGHAEGQNTIAGTAAHAEGSQNEATGVYSHSEGLLTKASAQSAHAEGESTKSTASATHAEGYGTEASGAYAHSEGVQSVASGIGSHAAGGNTEATGPWSHAEGYGTKANGNSSHAGGMGTIANAEAQTVIGKYNVQDSSMAFIVGAGTSGSQRKNALAVGWNGTVYAGGNILATEDFVRACVEEAIAKIK